jgi:hypothetical protein
MAQPKRQRKKAPTVPAKAASGDLPLTVSTKAKGGLKTDLAPQRVSVPKNAPAAEWVCNDCKDTKDPNKKLCLCAPPKVREVFDPRFAVPQTPVAAGTRKKPTKGADVRGLRGLISGGAMPLVLIVGVIAVGIFAYSRKAESNPTPSTV